eukprot:308095_1
MSTVVCKYCKSTGSGSKLKCARCHSVYYCNVKCQRADWKQHKSQCERKIILPNVPNIDLNTITKDTIDIQCIQTTKQLRESFNHRKAYTAITNTQCFPTKAILELLTDILLSPLTFWSVQSIDIQFIGNENPSKPISNSCIRNFFNVISKLPKLKRFRIRDMESRGINTETIKIRKAYVHSFQPNTYQTLNELFIPIDDVFYSCDIDYSAFISFIHKACNIEAVEISIRYGISDCHSVQQMTSFREATKRLFLAISVGLSVESFSFGINDCWNEYIDAIDPHFSQLLFESLGVAIVSQRNLNNLCILGRTFSKPLQDALWKLLADNIQSLSELYLGGIQIVCDISDAYFKLRGRCPICTSFPKMNQKRYCAKSSNTIFQIKCCF